MDARGYSKGIIISDTSPNPFILVGTGECLQPFRQPDGCGDLPGNRGRPMSHSAVLPASACANDKETVDWMRGFIAADMVKKTVIAAEQGIELINTSFTTDLPILSTPLGFAGSGNAGWGGMVVIGTGQRYANYFAMQQLISHIDGYTSIQRVDTPETGWCPSLRAAGW